MQPTPPLVWCEHNHHDGIQGVIRSGRFKDYPNFYFTQPPIYMDLHALDKSYDDKPYKWSMEIRQNRLDTRPRIKITNENGFGFRIRLLARRYNDLTDVIQQMSKEYRLVKNDVTGVLMTTREVIKEVPVTKTVFVDVPYTTTRQEQVAKPAEFADIVDTLKAHNDKALEHLGDWRPGKPDLTNVVDFEKRLQEIQAANNPPPEFDYQKALKALSS
jgi:hypothetical protein